MRKKTTIKVKIERIIKASFAELIIMKSILIFITYLVYSFDSIGGVQIAWYTRLAASRAHPQCSVTPDPPWP